MLSFGGGGGGGGGGGVQLHFVPKHTCARTHTPTHILPRVATNKQLATTQTKQLFLGDTNRAIGETPANQASSRSHCVFTIDLEARRAGEARLWRARLNLVDLAGSERFGKPGADGGGGGGGGAVLREARHINLSLHFLEQVIIALQERAAAAAAAGVGGSGSAAGGTGGRQHVPYRNSLMTTMLRDSLGGNCRTVMVATITGAQEHVSACCREGGWG